MAINNPEAATQPVNYTRRDSPPTAETTKPFRYPEYPESTGRPIADNTEQFRYITMIQGGLDALFQADPDVFVAGDFLWYPVEGHPEISAAPDTLVAFGRPKGDRGSYLQWQEGNIPPQVVFEILSPSNRAGEMVRKFRFYERYGVEEYYLYDPDDGDLSGWIRQGALLEEIPQMRGWVSPRLGVRFDLSGKTLEIFGPDGHRFLTYTELAIKAEFAAARANAADARANAADARAESEAARAESEAARAAAAEARAEYLLARLRAAGLDATETP